MVASCRRAVTHRAQSAIWHAVFLAASFRFIWLQERKYFFEPLRRFIRYSGHDNSRRFEPRMSYVFLARESKHLEGNGLPTRGVYACCVMRLKRFDRSVDLIRWEN